MVQAEFDRHKFNFDYEVEGKHFTSLAVAENYAKELLNKHNYKSVVINKDNKELEYWFWRNNRIEFQKIKIQK